MIRLGAMQIHRGDGYRDHYALMATVFTPFFISSAYDEAFKRGVYECIVVLLINLARCCDGHCDASGDCRPTISSSTSQKAIHFDMSLAVVKVDT